MDYAHPILADALASQYALGTLRGAARRRYEALLPSHPGLRAAHERWQQRLMPLAAALVPEPPPPRVWRAIERRLWPATGPEPWWRRLAPWRFATTLAGSAALVLALLLARPDPVLAPVVVVLQATPADGGRATFVASVSGDGRALVTRPLLPVAVQADRALELWSVPPDGAPRSLGVISAAGVTAVARDKLPATLLRGGTAALAVTLEPPGGSPTGAPTGPVVYSGKLQL